MLRLFCGLGRRRVFEFAPVHPDNLGERAKSTDHWAGEPRRRNVMPARGLACSIRVTTEFGRTTRYLSETGHCGGLALKWVVMRLLRCLDRDCHSRNLRKGCYSHDGRFSGLAPGGHDLMGALAVHRAVLSASSERFWPAAIAKTRSRIRRFACLARPGPHTRRVQSLAHVSGAFLVGNCGLSVAGR